MSLSDPTQPASSAALGELKLAIPGADPAARFTGERFVPGLKGEIELEHLHRYLVAAHLCESKDVLDVACGNGYGSYILAQIAREVCGVDVDPETIHHARDRYPLPNLRFEIGTCQAIPLS